MREEAGNGQAIRRRGGSHLDLLHTLRFRLRRCCNTDVGDCEGALDVLAKLSRQLVISSRMGGGRFIGDANATLDRKESVDVQGQAQFTISVQLELERKLDCHEEPVRGDVVGVAALPPIRLQPVTLEGEKDVAALPAPVKPVHVRVERMARSEAARTCVILAFWHADGKADAVVVSDRHIGQREGGPPLASADIGELIRLFEPPTARVPQCHLREQKVQSSDGDRLPGGGDIRQRIKDQRGIAEARLHFNADGRRHRAGG